MSKENQLQKYDSMRPTTLGEAIEFGKLIASSSFVPQQYKGKHGDVVVAMQMGSELGLAPMQSLQNIAVINGRPSVWGDALLAIVSNHPDCEDIIETNIQGQSATCEVKRKGRTPVKRTFTVDDAKRAGLWGKSGPWKTYPDRMLQMRARGFALRDAFPDALRGLITAEEAQDIPADKTQKSVQVVEARFEEAEPAPKRILHKIKKNGKSKLQDVLAAIESAKDKTDLDSTVAKCKELKGPDLIAAREAFAARSKDFDQVKQEPEQQDLIEPPPLTDDQICDLLDGEIIEQDVKRLQR